MVEDLACRAQDFGLYPAFSRKRGRPGSGSKSAIHLA